MWGQAVWMMALITGMKLDLSSAYNRILPFTHEYLNSNQHLKGNAPRFLYRFLEQSMSRGCTVSMKCIATGSPTPSIKWLMDGFEPPTSERFMIGQYVMLNGDVVSHFNLTACSREDSSEVSCVATNEFGTATHKARLNIFGPPFVRDFGPALNALSGKDFVVKCPVGGFPIESITWLRDEKELPVTSRQSTSPDGILTIKNVQKSDKGNYTCVAKYKDQSHRKSLSLKVVAPPKLNYFGSVTVVEVGGRVVKYCEATGDSPIELQWDQDGLPLSPNDPPNPHIGVQQIGVDIAVALVISQAKRELAHSNFTCTARNEVGTDSLSTTLIVQVPPKWTLEPMDTEVMEGGTVLIPCEADAHPPPSIAWKKSIPGRNGIYVDIPNEASSGGSSFPFRTLRNGTLRVSAIVAQESNTIRLVCEAENGIGSGITKLIHLRVNVPVRIQGGRNTTVRMGSTALLRCVITGDHPIHVTWYRGREEIVDGMNHRFQLKTVNMTNGLTSELTLPSVRREDESFPFICTAKNLCSSACQVEKAEMWVVVLEPPETPLNLTLLLKGSRFVELGWKFRPHGNAAMTRVSIKYKMEGGPWKVIPIRRGEEAPSFVNGLNEWKNISTLVNDLKPSTTYHFLVTAQNLVGSSESQMLSLRTNEEPPDVVPRNIRLTPLSPTLIRAEWDPLSWSNGEVIGYHVGIRKTRDGGHYTFTKLENPAYELLLRQLRPFTQYEVVVRAFNGVGEGPLSKGLLVMTLESTPLSPQGLSCYTLTSQKLQVSWNQLTVEESRGVLKGYRIFIQKADMDFLLSKDELLVVNTSDTTAIADGLSKFTMYDIQIAGFTDRGEGELSSSVYCQTEQDIPGPPERVKVIRLGADSLLLAWSPPSVSEMNGEFSHFTLYLNNDVPRILPPNITNIKLKSHFPPQIAHISASTKIGEGGNVTISLLPDLGGGGGLISFGRSMTVLTKVDLSLHCQTVVGNPDRTWFHLSKRIQENERYFTESYGSVLRIKSVNLEDGGEYSCFQPAFIWEGTQFKAERISYTVRVRGPPSPPKLREQETTSDSILIRWSMKDTNRGSAEGFLLQYKVLDEWLEKKLPRRVSSYLLRDLSCGTTYPIYMTAYNKAGMSKSSQTLRISTKGGKPMLIISPQLLTEVNSTWIGVNLREAFNDGGCPLQHYKLFYRKKEKEGAWKSLDENLSGERRRGILSGLEPNTNYLLKVSAKNEAGRTEVTFSVTTRGFLQITAEPSNNTLLTSVSESIFEFRVLGPIFIALLFILILASILCLIFRKKIFWSGEDAPATEDSFTYFKQNSGDPSSYKTPNSFTPSKGSSRNPPNFDLLPHSTEGILPYATFELKDSSRSHRRPHSLNGPRKEEAKAYYISKEGHICNSKFPPVVWSNEESEEEYESIGSDSDSPRQRGRNYVYTGTSSRYTNRYEPTAKSNSKIKYGREVETYLDEKSNRGEKSRGFFPSGSLRGTGFGVRSGLVFCDDHPRDEDLCQIKV